MLLPLKKVNSPILGFILIPFFVKNKPPQLLQGQAIFFCSLLRHRVNKVKKGIRRSLVMWFGGPPFK